MSEFRIELRTYNVGAGHLLGKVGTGFAHNFLVLVEVEPDGATRPIAELHGESFDRKTGRIIPFDATNRGQLKVRLSDKETNYYQHSHDNPKFTLFRGSEKDARERFAWAKREGDWINAQNFAYDWRTRNSNSAANTLMRAMGFNVTGQPIDREGHSLPAPARELDLRDAAGKPRQADEITWMTPINGYGDDHTRPLAPARPVPPRELPGRSRGEAPGDAPPASSFALGFDNARRFQDEHGFDPSRADLMKEQKQIIDAWVLKALAPAIGYSRLPKPLGDDLLDYAASTTAHDAGFALQRGINRLAGPAAFGRAPPAFVDGMPARVAEDGRIGSETRGAVEHLAAVPGLETLREAVALAAFRQGLDRLAKGEAGADEAPGVFHRTVGRLFHNSASKERSGAGVAANALQAGGRPDWSATSLPRPRRRDVEGLQASLNDANRIFGFADRPLAVDGDLGPKTSAALVAAARAAGGERLADHLGKRLGIGEPDLMDNRARGFDYALAEDGVPGQAGGYGGFG